MVALQGDMSACLAQSFYDYDDLSTQDHNSMLMDALKQWDSYAFDGIMGMGDKNFNFIFRTVFNCMKVHFYDLDGRDEAAKEMAGKLYHADVGAALSYMMTMHEELERYLDTSDDSLLFNAYDFGMALDSMIYVVNNHITGIDRMLVSSGFNRYQKILISSKNSYFNKLVSNMHNKVFKLSSSKDWRIDRIDDNE